MKTNKAHFIDFVQFPNFHKQTCSETWTSWQNRVNSSPFSSTKKCFRTAL